MKNVKIYQIDNIRDCKYLFRGYGESILDFNSKDYKEVYRMTVEDERDFDILNKLWNKFNLDKPSDYAGRSMSVSDVVMIDDKTYYCDNFGWAVVEKFNVDVTDNGSHYVGEKLTLSQRTGNGWIDMVKHPYEVVKIMTPNKILVRECRLIFNGPCYYDTIADDIVSDINGSTIELRWNNKRQAWISNIKESAGYPYYAKFGKWEHQPYLD